MLLCLCKGVSDRVVRLAVLSGANTIEAVGARCGAGTDCGACCSMIHDMIEETAAEAGPATASGHQPCRDGETAHPPALQAASAL